MNDEIESVSLSCGLHDCQSISKTYIPSNNHQRLTDTQNESSLSVKYNQPANSRCFEWDIIMRHCRVFCETTSLRGVPRIAKTNDRKRRCLWIFFVTAFFLACITCIFLLIMQYRQYDVIHQPKTVYNTPRPFPSLSICNLRPLSSHSFKNLKDAGLNSITEYLTKLKRSMEVVRQSGSKIERKLLTMSWNINSYFLNLPNSTLPIDLGHERLEMVMICILAYKEGIYTSGILCDKAGQWVTTLNSVYLNCHTFIINEKYSNRTFNVEMVLYLDNADGVKCNDCNEMMIASQLTGIRLNLHSSGTYPEIIGKGINLMPGTLTEIRFIPREWSMMEPPHGKCSKTISKKISFNKVNFEYSEEACKKKVLQEELAKNCDCVDFNQIPDELYHYLSNKKICKYLPSSPFSNDSLTFFNRSQVNDYFKKTLCELETSSNLQNHLSKCNSPCIFYTYDTTISSAEWPTKSYHASFLKSINDIIPKKLKAYPQANNSTKSAWETIKKELKPYLEKNTTENKTILNELKFVSNNFLSILVSRSNFDIIRVEEKATVSLTNFLSQTGGIFSIWSGITFFCIVEILELFILIIDDLMLKRNDPQDMKREVICS